MACSRVNFNWKDRNMTNIESRCVLSLVNIKGISIVTINTTQCFDNYLFPSSGELKLTSNQVNHYDKSGENYVTPHTIFKNLHDIINL